MEQFLDRLNAYFGAWPFLALLMVIIFLLLLRTRRTIGEYVGEQHPRLLWFIELVSLPLLLLSMLALLRFFLSGALADLLTPGAFDRMTAALFWLLGGWLLTRALDAFFWDDIFQQFFHSEAPDLLRGVVAGSIYLLALYGVVTVVFQRETTGVLISTGIIAGVLGLALQSTLADLFSGLAVTMDRPYSVGHWIELPDGVLGQVVDITWKSTRIRSFNNSIYVIPNSLASSSIIHNYDLPHKAYSVWFTVSVDAQAPPTVVRRLLLDAVLNSSRVLKEPPPAIRLFDMTGQPYEYLVWIYFEDYMAQFMGKEQVFMNIWLEFSKVGITPAAVKFNVASRPETGPPDIHGPTLADELARTDLFEVLSPAEIKTLAQVCHKRIYTADDVILAADEPTDSMYLISAGIVSMQRPITPDQSVELERLEAGSWFGSVASLTGQPSYTTVKAVTLSELIEIPQAGLEPILQANPALAEAMAQIMAQRQTRLAELSADSGVTTGEALLRSAGEIMAKLRKAFSGGDTLDS